MASYELSPVTCPGFLNSMDREGECHLQAMCEAGREANMMGSVGRVVAIVASDNAELWMKKMTSVSGRGISEAVLAGTDGAVCEEKYPCQSWPDHYTHPGIVPQRTL